MTAPAAPAAAPKGRLGNGQLRRQVAEYLADHPGPCNARRDRQGPRQVGRRGRQRADHPRRPGRGRPRSPASPSATRRTPPPPPQPPPSRRGHPAPPSPARRPRPPPAPARLAAPPQPRHPPPPAAAGPVTRPNGQVYQPRSLADMPDVEALRKLRDGGSAGPAVRAARYRQDQPDRGRLPRPDHGRRRRRHHGRRPGRRVHPEPRRHLHLHLRAADPRHGRRGRVLFIDDATLISPAVLAVAYPAMDGRREITVKAHKGEVIKAADGFYVVAGHNPGVHGAILTEALSSRFSVQVEVTTDYDLARASRSTPARSGRPRPRRPAGQRRDRLGTPAPRAPRLRQGRRHPRRERRHRQPGRHRPRGGPRRRSRRRRQGLRRARRSPPSPSAASSNPRPPRPGKDRPPCQPRRPRPRRPRPPPGSPPPPATGRPSPTP